jgi:hypothetical protein
MISYMISYKMILLCLIYLLMFVGFRYVSDPLLYHLTSSSSSYYLYNIFFVFSDIRSPDSQKIYLLQTSFNLWMHIDFNFLQYFNNLLYLDGYLDNLITKKLDISKNDDWNYLHVLLF